MRVIRSRLKRDKNRISIEVPARQTVAPVEATDQRSNTVISTLQLSDFHSVISTVLVVVGKNQRFTSERASDVRPRANVPQSLLLLF